MNCILIKKLEKFISSLIKPFIVDCMGNIWNQSLDLIVKFIPNQRVCRTLKKKVTFVFY